MTSYLYYSVIIYHNYISALGRQYYGGKPNDSFCVSTLSLSHIPSHIYILTPKCEKYRCALSSLTNINT